MLNKYVKTSHLRGAASHQPVQAAHTSQFTLGMPRRKSGLSCQVMLL